MKIAVATMHSPAYSEIAEITIPVMEAYCSKHGYDFIEIKVEDEKWMYKKHECFRDLMRTSVNAILYLDIDAIFTNFNARIESFIDEAYHFFITKDANELNGGVVLIRNTYWGRLFNDYILNQRNKYENEQNVFNDLPPHMEELMKVVPHPSFNSYLYEHYAPYYTNHVGKPEKGQWQEGQFILHTPGLPISQRAEILNDVKIIE